MTQKNHQTEPISSVYSSDMSEQVGGAGAHLQVGCELDGDGAEDGVFGLRLLLVVRDDVLEGDVLQLVDLAHAVQRAQDHLVQVAPIQQARVVQHHMRHHRIHLRMRIKGSHAAAAKRIGACHCRSAEQQSLHLLWPLFTNLCYMHLFTCLFL